MNKTEISDGAIDEVAAPVEVVEREAGLQRKLTPGQLAMIGLGSTIGTGLFLGSAISVKLAGPAVILSFAGAACIAVTLCGDVPASVGRIRDSADVLVVHDGGGGQRSGSCVNLLQILVSGDSIVGLDRIVLRADPLRQLHQRRKSWDF